MQVSAGKVHTNQTASVILLGNSALELFHVTPRSCDKYACNILTHAEINHEMYK